MNGRIDLMQAEAVMGVISARSAAALRAGERQLEGGQSRFIRKAQEDLTALLSGLEAHIDYPDEIGEDEALFRPVRGAGQADCAAGWGD